MFSAICLASGAIQALTKFLSRFVTVATLLSLINSEIEARATKIPVNRTDATFRDPVAVLISLDGFRWDYFERAELKNFNYIIKRGVKAQSLKSTFITKTFPNHFTMATGLYEESHGIIANRMFDPIFNETFVPSTTDSKWWNASVPIWIQNELHSEESAHGSGKSTKDKTRRSATIFWVGSNVKYNGNLPTFYFPIYNSSFSTEERFNMVISLLKEENPPNFIACYIDEPDKTGHNYGPESEQMKKTLVELDSLFGEFLQKMKNNGFLEHVNLIIVSDHGMASIKPSNQIVLNDVISDELYTAVNMDVFASIMPKAGFETVIYEKLKGTSHLTVYRKEDIPAHLHYKNNRRVPDILAVADEGFIIKQHRENITRTTGNHGYVNDYKTMHGIFIAAGPAFRTNYISSTFSNIHVYELLCKVLGIRPAPNNGSLLAVEHLLVDSLQTKHSILESLPLKIIIISAISLLMLVVLIGIFIQCCKGSIKASNGYIGAYRKGNGTYLYNLTEDFALDEESSEEDEI